MRTTESTTRLVILVALAAFVVFAVARQTHRGSTWTPEELADPNIEVGAIVRLSGRVVGSDASNSVIVAPEDADEPTVHVILSASQNPLPRTGESVIIDGMIDQPGSLQSGVLVSPGAPSERGVSGEHQAP